MALDYQQVCQRVAEKARLVARRYERAVAERDEALGEVARLQAQLSKCESQITLLKTQVENLTVVTTAFPSKQAIADSREYLSGLVREIDQCIKDLTN